MLWALISTLIAGAVAGWLAGLLMGGPRHDWVRNIAVGVVGSVLGRILASFIGISARSFSLGGLAISVAGSCLLLFLMRKLAK